MTLSIQMKVVEYQTYDTVLNQQTQNWGLSLLVQSTELTALGEVPSPKLLIMLPILFCWLHID
jgi:hypothetical protein